MSVLSLYSIGTGLSIVGQSSCYYAGCLGLGSGAVGAITNTISVGALPPGMTLQSPNQQVSSFDSQYVFGFTRIEGSPTTPGTYHFTVHAVDSAGNTGDSAQTIVVSATQTGSLPETMTLPRPVLGSPYSFTFNTAYINSLFSISDTGTVGPWTTTITNPSDPADLLALYNMDLTAGVLSTASFQMNEGGQSIDEVNSFGFLSFSVSGFKAGVPHTLTNEGTCVFFVINYFIDIESAPPNGFVGVPYTHTFSCTEPSNGVYVPVFTFQFLGGELPPGLTFDTTTGILSGTPTVAGVYGGDAGGIFAIAGDQFGMLGYGGVDPLGPTTGWTITIGPAPPPVTPHKVFIIDQNKLPYLYLSFCVKKKNKRNI